MADRKKRLVSRRQFLAYAAMGGGAATLGTLPLAEAALLPKPAESERFDVVVLGTGLAGMAAAVEAQLAGAKVVVLEKRPAKDAGGNTKLAGGFLAIPMEDTQAAKDAFYEDLMRKNKGAGSAEVSRLMADHATEGYEWLKAQGVAFLPAMPLAGYRVKAPVFAPGLNRGGGPALAKLREGLEVRGGRVAYETKAKQLLLDERGGVVGVRASTAKGLKDYLAGSVVIATGGYAGNKQLLEQYVDPDADGMTVRGTPWATGDGLLMAQEAGALLVNMGGMASLHIAATHVNSRASGNPSVGTPHCLGINREGKRYVDESEGYVAHGKAAMKQPGQVVALVFDEETKKEPLVATCVKRFEGLGLEVIAADTLEGLAAKIGADPAGFVKTVTEFNAAVQNGVAPGANPPKAKYAHKLATPKFYAFYPLKPGVTLTFGGIAINTKAQAVEADGSPIPGLYAAGECAGGPFYADYIAGAALANCVVTGRLAGRGAAAESKQRA